MLRVTAACLAASLVVGNVWVLQRTGVHPAKPWVQTLLRGVRQGPRPIYDDNAPAKLPGFPVGAEGRLSFLLAPVDKGFTFDQPAETLYLPDSSGHLRPAEVGDAIRAEPGPRTGCGYLMEPGSTLNVPMTGTLFDYHWGMQLTAYAGTGGILDVDVDGRHVQLEIDKGFARHQVGIQGTVTDVRLHLLPGSQPVCVTDLIFGAVTPDSKGGAG